MPHLLNLERSFEADENAVDAGKEGNEPTTDSEASSNGAAEKAEEEKKVGATSALPKITQAGYSSLEVHISCPYVASRHRD